MFKKGRKREAKGLAVVYFFIGLIILLIILAVIYFALVELDYSDRIKDPDATMRSYVAITPDPNAPFEETEEEVFEAEETSSELDVDLTVATSTPEPTPTPTPEPTPTPTPVPTPTPTPLPATLLAQPRTAGFSLPQTSAANCQAAITNCYVSMGDNNRLMYLTGYCFINEANYDAAQSQLYLVVTQSRTNQLIAYQVTMRPGISGDPHEGAMCKNPASGDFEVAFDVSQLYTEDIYNLGVVIGYKPNGNRKATYSYYAFPSDVSFTVLAGQVVEPVKVAGSAAVEAIPTSVPGAVLPDGSIDTGFDTTEPEDLEPPVTPIPTPVQGAYNPALAGATQQPTANGAYNPALVGTTQQPAANGYNPALAGATQQPVANGAYNPALAGATQAPVSNGVYNPALAGATQQPTIDNASELLTNTAAIQEQIYQNQMGIG